MPNGYTFGYDSLVFQLAEVLVTREMLAGALERISWRMERGVFPPETCNTATLNRKARLVGQTSSNAWV